MFRRGVQQSIDLIHPQRTKPFHRDGWVYEEKYDGWRTVAFKDGQRVRVISRTGRDHAARFPEIAKAIAALPVQTVILDGEICRFDENLVPRYQATYVARKGAAAPIGQNCAEPRFLMRGRRFGNARGLRPQSVGCHV